MNSFVLSAYAGLAASRTFLQWLLACLNFTLDSEALFCLYKQKKCFYKLWQQHKQLKTMEMSDIYNDLIFTMSNIYSNSNLNPLIKFTSSSRNTEFKSILPWNISQMVTKTILISLKLCNEMEHPVLSLTESQWKLRETHDQTFPMEGKPL